MGGGLESRCVGRVYGADGARHDILRWVIPVVLVQQQGTWCINTYSRTQLYLRLVLQEEYSNYMFRLCTGPSSGCD